MSSNTGKGQIMNIYLKMTRLKIYKFDIFGSYNLRILNFALTDAGMYKCEDSTDPGHPYGAQVIAIGK